MFLGKLLETLDKNEETLFLARDQLKRPPPSRIGPTALAPPDATSKPRQTAKPAGAAPVSASSITEKDEGNFKRNESASVEEEQPAQTTMWNPSTKVAPTFWPRDPVLRDCYPRDPYTHMPYPDSTPLALNVRAGDPAAVLQRENQSLNDPSLPPIEPERPIQKGARDLFSTEQKRKARADCYKGQAEEREREKRRTKAIEEAEAVVREKRLPLVPKVASQELLSRLERSVVAGDGVREHLPEVSSSDVRSLRRELKLSANLEGRRVGRAVAHDAFAAALGAHVADSYSGAYAQGVRGDRPAVFRCHHVLDVQRRRHTRPNSSLPDRGADAAIVLCNDPTSQLFRLALLEGVNTNPKPEPNAETEKID